MTVYLFPGQGSQFRGMGGDLFDTFPKITRRADEILGYSVKSLCLDDPERKLDNTRYTQPAMFVVNALFFERFASGHVGPAAVAGHSLGEYNALCAARAISFDDALTLVMRRGELMSEAKGGAMAAVMGVDAKAVQNCLLEQGLFGVDIANYNSPLQTVISGPKGEIEQSEGALAHIKATFVPLKISAAFHSRHMAPLQAKYHEFLRDFSFSEPAVPVISNVYAEPYQTPTIGSTLAIHLTHSVKWIQSMNYLFERGERDFEELGPGEVLKKLATRNLDHYYASGGADLYAPGATAPGIGGRGGIAMDGPRHSIDFHDAKSAQLQADEWNRHHAVATPVKIKGRDEILQTRAQATVLFGRRAVVYLGGYRGYFYLEDVTAMNS